jgi:hypothetical protein
MVNFKTTNMKNLYYLIAISLLTTGCDKLDNYDPPSAKLSGRVIDSENNELIENGAANNGTKIQLFEGNSVQPITTNSFPEGNFVNATLFPGFYKLVAIGAFKLAGDTIRLNIGENTTADIKVIPNLRLKAVIQSSDATSATVKVTYQKVATSQILSQLAVVWSTINNPNMSMVFEGGLKAESVASQNLTSGEKIFTLTELKPGVKYYIRAAGATNNAGNYFNYSTTIKMP